MTTKTKQKPVRFKVSGLIVIDTRAQLAVCRCWDKRDADRIASALNAYESKRKDGGK